MARISTDDDFEVTFDLDVPACYIPVQELDLIEASLGDLLQIMLAEAGREQQEEER